MIADRQMIVRIFMQGFLLLLLQACTVGPNYEPPKTDLAPFHNLPDASDRQAGAEPTPLDRWWIGFNDPILVTFVQRALDQNLTLAAALARVDQARAEATGAGAQLLPTVDLGASSTALHQSLQGLFGNVAKNVPSFRRNINENVIGPLASWEIDLFGGRRRAIAASQNLAEASELDRAGIRLTVAADTADTYLQIRGYQVRLELAENQISTNERLVRLVRNRRDAGVATEREIAEADAVLRQARAIVPPLRFALEQQLNRLSVLMGVQPGTYSQDLKAVREIPPIPIIPGEQHSTDMLRRRPDVIAAERRLAASNEQIGVVISDYYPKISISGMLGFDSLSTRNIFTGGAFVALGSGAVRWRLFDFGKIDAQVAQARGANAEALIVYRQAVLRAVEDVENALSGLSQTQAHVFELQGETQSLIKSRDLADQAYRAGSIPLTDVLVAERQLLLVQDQLNARRADTARAAVTVFRSLGGGW
ncbi:MAG: efflux transporter outer membrane subunit [Nitrospira sp.]|nr:efflux transporter outer membrane subunit [Nitrospira sp.]